MVDIKKINAMLLLLDDEDCSIVEIVNNAFIDMGNSVIPLLEEIWEHSSSEQEQHKITHLLQFLNRHFLIQDFVDWKNSPTPKLMQLCMLVARIKYPGLSQAAVNTYIQNVSTEVWVKLWNTEHPTDQVLTLNHVLFEQFALMGDHDTYNHPDNSCLHKVIERRRGNPITMACLYMLVAHNLGIPVFGVNSPQHFILAYCQPSSFDSKQSTLEINRQLEPTDYGKILFYINPFNKGQMFSQNSLLEFLKKVNVQALDTFTQPCTLMDIMLRMLRNLHFALGEQKDMDTQNFVAQIQKKMEE